MEEGKYIQSYHINLIGDTFSKYWYEFLNDKLKNPTFSPSFDKNLNVLDTLYPLYTNYMPRISLEGETSFVGNFCTSSEIKILITCS